jgi:hypothetical protein
MGGLAAGCDPWPVSLPDDRPPPRRPLFFPVVIAAVFLAIIGMSAGLVLGARAKDEAKRAATEEQTVTSPSNPPAGPPCRPETVAQAQLVNATGSLHIVLLIRTSTSVVWICSDEAGRLYYHANRGGEAAVWVEGKTALFLTDVTADGDVYTAVAEDGQGRRTTFKVSPDRLLIVHKDGSEEEQAAVPQ